LSEEILKETPLRGMRGAIAQTMTLSLREMAQLTLQRRVDVTAVEELRAQRPGELSVNDVMLCAVTRVLGEFPQVNATLEDGTIKSWAAVNLGVAVALDDGLVVPVVKGAERLTAQEIGTETRRLAGLARGGELAMADLSGGTFTVTNLGALGIDFFTPIVNPPQVAILGVGRIRESEIGLSLTIDHRALDGAPGAQFLAALAEALAAPEALLEPLESAV
jgi:pyruvate dehydrogenase E2 component (dihydrolipoamide acetyltransferase)